MAPTLRGGGRAPPGDALSAAPRRVSAGRASLPLSALLCVDRASSGCEFRRDRRHWTHRVGETHNYANHEIELSWILPPGPLSEERAARSATADRTVGRAMLRELNDDAQTVCRKVVQLVLRLSCLLAGARGGGGLRVGGQGPRSALNYS